MPDQIERFVMNQRTWGAGGPDQRRNLPCRSCGAGRCPLAARRPAPRLWGRSLCGRPFSR